MTDLERRALAIWQAREMTFPRFVRRMQPDDFDRMSGAWDAVLRIAEGDERRDSSASTERPKGTPKPPPMETQTT